MLKANLSAKDALGTGSFDCPNCGHRLSKQTLRDEKPDGSSFADVYYYCPNCGKEYEPDEIEGSEG